MNETWHIWMSHGTYIWVTSHTYESCHIYVSHITYMWVMSHMTESITYHLWDWASATGPTHHKRVMPHMNETWHIWMSHVTYIWVMSHIHESCHIYMSHVTYDWVNQISTLGSWASATGPTKHEWVMSHVCMSHDTYERVMSHEHLGIIGVGNRAHKTRSHHRTNLERSPHIRDHCWTSFWLRLHQRGVFS